MTDKFGSIASHHVDAATQKGVLLQCRYGICRRRLRRIGHVFLSGKSKRNIRAGSVGKRYTIANIRSGTASRSLWKQAFALAANDDCEDRNESPDTMTGQSAEYRRSACIGVKRELRAEEFTTSACKNTDRHRRKRACSADLELVSVLSTEGIWTMNRSDR